MAEKVTRDVLDLFTRPLIYEPEVIGVHPERGGILIDGSAQPGGCGGGRFSIEAVPIGQLSQCNGKFLELESINDTIVGGDLQVTGTITAAGGHIDLSGTFRVTNMADPVDPQDAITLNYADNRYINAAGDSMVGSLLLSGEPTASNEASTKSYADKALRPDSVTVGTPTAPKYYISSGGPSGGSDGDIWFQFS